jgi:hypothetical protein
MHEQCATEQDPAAAVIPWRVVEVRPLDALQLEVRFADHARGVVDLRMLVESGHAGVFAALRDRALFERAKLEHGAVSWPGGLDLAPDAMHAAIKRDGIWQLK